METTGPCTTILLSHWPRPPQEEHKFGLKAKWTMQEPTAGGCQLTMALYLGSPWMERNLPICHGASPVPASGLSGPHLVCVNPVPHVHKGSPFTLSIHCLPSLLPHWTKGTSLQESVFSLPLLPSTEDFPFIYLLTLPKTHHYLGKYLYNLNHQDSS